MKKGGPPPVVVVPKSYAPKDVSVEGHIRSFFRGASSEEKLKDLTAKYEEILEKIVDLVPGYFSLPRYSEEAAFKWLPERPMWVTEKDFLVSKFPAVKGILETVFDNSQFSTHNHWRVRI